MPDHQEVVDLRLSTLEENYKDIKKTLHEIRKELGQQRLYIVILAMTVALNVVGNTGGNVLAGLLR